MNVPVIIACDAMSFVFGQFGQVKHVLRGSGRAKEGNDVLTYGGENSEDEYDPVKWAANGPGNSPVEYLSDHIWVSNESCTLALSSSAIS